MPRSLTKKYIEFEDIEEQNPAKKPKTDKSDAFCGVCFVEDVSKKVQAEYLCYKCEVYFCYQCYLEQDSRFKKRKSHRCVNFLTFGERKDKPRIKLLKNFRKKSECDLEIAEKNTLVCDRINIKSDIDNRDCILTGFCEIGSKWLGVCDSGNSCIKIYKLGSYNLLCYIHLRQEPYAISQIKDRASLLNLQELQSRSIILDKMFSLIVITLPWERQICIAGINLTQDTSKILHVIKVPLPCFGVKYVDETLYTVCTKDPDTDVQTYSIFILKLTGEIMTIVETDIKELAPELVVLSEKMYLTDYWNDRLLCLMKNGETLFDTPLEKSGPKGIAFDQDETIYVCSG